MYAWLTIDLTAPIPELRAMWYRSATRSVPKLAPGELERQQALLISILKTSYASISNAEREQLRQRVGPMLRYITGDPGSQNFAIHMALAHHRLPPGVRSNREGLIDQRIHEFFGDAGPLPPQVIEGLTMLRQTALLVPDALIDLYLRSECSQHYIQLQLFNGSQTPMVEPPLGFTHLNEVAALIAPGRAKSILPAMYTAYAVCRPEERDGLVAMLITTHVDKCDDAFEAISAAVDALPGPSELSFRIGGLIEALARLLANRQRPPDEALSMADVIAAQMAKMQQQMARTNELLLITTVAALRAGVPMGTLGDDSKTMLAQLEQRVQRMDELMTPERMRNASQRVATAGPTNPAQTDTDTAKDLDPVHAWSVNRLLRWIEGPLASRAGSQPARIDRNAIAAREARETRERRLRAGAQAREQEKGKGARTPAARPAQGQAFTANDIELAVQGALSATARFFIDDITELLPLATRLQAPAEPMEACHRLLRPLNGLLRPGVNDNEARALLGQAETAIAALRERIHLAEVSLQKQERFADRLASALAAEPLVLGKQHGGVIDCRMDAADWAWAAQTYHRRWLPRARSLSIDGHVVVLPPDQALALYVTGSSLSNHLFDISVHLWRRRPDRDSAPSQGTELYPPMNEDDWFDTYLPCCVLHVPPGNAS